MNQEAIDRRLRQIFASLFQIASEEIHDDLALGDFEPWDSLQHLNLVLAIEEELEIQLEPEQVSAMRTFGAARRIVVKVLGQASEWNLRLTPASFGEGGLM